MQVRAAIKVALTYAKLPAFIDARNSFWLKVKEMSHLCLGMSKQAS